MAIAALLTRAQAGALDLSPHTVVVVDELSQVGTAQALGLLRLQAQHGFSIVAIGDDKQAQAIEAGSTIALLRKALGAEAVPELESTVRQLRDRDKETSLLFRQGRADEAIGRLREDGHAMLVQGGHRHAVAAVADLWEARQRANADRADYTLTVSAPTNGDARAISTAIRERRRRSGDIGPDQVKVQARDQNGAEFELPLAVGDRVRLFARTNASMQGRASPIGHNGSVLQVERIENEGLKLRNAKGTAGFVKWDTLRDPTSGRVRLTYGDVITIDAIQSATSTEHINALPSGSDAVQSFKAYVAQSRSRETTWLVVADGRERAEIMSGRALGNVEPISEADVWKNVARNLSRQPEKELATDLLDGARGVHVGAVRSLATAFQPKQQREAEGREGTTLHRTYAQRRGEQDVAREAAGMGAAASTVATAAHEIAKRLKGPVQNETRKAVRAARRSMRAPSHQAAKDAQRRARETAVAQKAVALWNQAKPVQTHPYLVAKQVAAHGLRRDRRNKLLVPMQDVDGRLWGVQTITLDGRKLFMRDGRKRGMHAVLGEMQPGAPVVITEGFATAATIREATGLTAIVAFDSGNLMDVARAIRGRDPDRPIIIAADSHHHLPRREIPIPNVGLEKATAAAGAAQGVLLTPAFSPADKGTDWNDYAAQHGKAAVRTQIQETLRTSGSSIKLPKPSQRVVPVPAHQATRITTQAEREAARAQTASTARSSGAARSSSQTQQATLRPSTPKL